MAEKKRGVLLTIWLAFILIVNAIMGVVYLLAGPAVDPTLPPLMLYFGGVMMLLNALFAAYLFMWKKWAFFALCGIAGTAFIINIIYMGIATALLGVLGIIILYLILIPKWNLLE